MRTNQTALEVERYDRAIESDISHVTGRGPYRSDRKYVLHIPALFSYYGISTSTMATASDQWSHNSLWGSLGCAHAQPEVAQYSPYWGLLPGSNALKRHPGVTERSRKGVEWVCACVTGSCAISEKSNAYTCIEREGGGRRRWRRRRRRSVAEEEEEGGGAYTCIYIVFQKWEESSWNSIFLLEIASRDQIYLFIHLTLRLFSTHTVRTRTW